MLSCLVSTLTYAQNKYKVGVIPSPPFAHFHSNGVNGITVDIWERIAQQAGIQFQFVKANAYIPKAIEDLKQKKYDVLIGAFSVTSQRLKDLRFSRPYFITRLGVIRKDNPSSFLGIFQDIISNFWFECIFFSLLLLLIFAHIHMRAEHAKDKSKQTKGYKKYLSPPDTYYHYLVTFFSQSSIQYPTNTNVSRFLNLLTILISVIFFSSLIGVLTTALTISSSNLEYNKGAALDSLYAQKIIVIKESYADEVAKQLSLDVIKVNDFKEAIDTLERTKNTVVLGKYLELKEYLKSHHGTGIESNLTFVAANEYAFAFREGDKLTKKINMSLLLMQEKNEILPICRKYLSKEDSLACMI